MAYHLSNLGQYGRDVERYADVDGYVPEAGDKLGTMNYTVETERGLRDEETWADWLRDAIAATVGANRAVQAWREL